MTSIKKGFVALVASSLFLAATAHAQEQQEQQRQRDQQQAQETAQGQIQQVSAAQNQFTLKDQQGQNRTFQLSKSAQVRVNGKDSNLAGLNQGDRVTVRFQLVGREVRAAQGERAGNLVQGQVRQINQDQNQLTIRDRQGNEQTVQLDQNARVRVQGQDRNLNQLKEGDEVTIRGERQGDQLRAQEVYGHQQGEQAVVGQVRQVSGEGQQQQIVVRDQQGRERTIRLGQNAQTHINGRQGELSNVREGDQVVILVTPLAQEVRSEPQDR